jgi:hypothetical protein
LPWAVDEFCQPSPAPVFLTVASADGLPHSG